MLSQINFTDVIKNKFLEEFTAISITDALIAVALSFALSLFIVFIYRLTYGGVSYNKNFAGTMVMLSMVTTVVIIVISSNVVLSLGMVGALSIVRFRTAIKEPADTAFAFWAIATGITCGAGLVTISLLMTLLVGLLFFLLHAIAKGKRAGTYMVVVRYNADCDVDSLLSGFAGYKLKNKNMTQQTTEVVTEVRLTQEEVSKLEKLREAAGVQEITVMSSMGGSVL